MATKIRKTQEDEIIEVLKNEGFSELSRKDVRGEPYKSIYSLPECLQSNSKPKRPEKKQA